MPSKKTKRDMSGENNPNAILTSEQVMTARDLNGPARIECVAELARWYGVSYSAMHKACRGDLAYYGTWTHLPNPAPFTGHEWFGTRANGGYRDFDWGKSSVSRKT